MTLDIISKKNSLIVFLKHLLLCTTRRSYSFDTEEIPFVYYIFRLRIYITLSIELCRFYSITEKLLLHDLKIESIANILVYYSQNRRAVKTLEALSGSEYFSETKIGIEAMKRIIISTFKFLLQLLS